MNEDAPIDYAKLDQARRELGADFLRILGYFEEDGFKSITAIEAAVRGRDAVALVRPAHTLKGESLQFGAQALGLAAERIEKAARDAVEDHAFPIETLESVVQLRPLFADTLALLRRAPPPVMPLRRVGGFGRKLA